MYLLPRVPIRCGKYEKHNEPQFKYSWFEEDSQETTVKGEVMAEQDNKRSMGDILKEAVNSGNFDEFNMRMNSMVDSAVNTAGNILSTSTTAVKSSYQNHNEAAARKEREKRRRELAPISKSIPGSVSGPVMIGFGIAILAACMIIGFATGAFKAFSYAFWVLILPALIAVYLLMRGGVLNKQANQAKAFIDTFDGRPYASVKELAASVRISQAAAVKKLTALTEDQVFPKGCFTEDDKYFLLSPGAKEMLEEDLAAEAKQKEEAARQEKLKKLYPKLAEAREDIDQALATIEDMRKSKTALKKPELSDELDRLETLLKNISRYIAQNPENVKNIRSFLDYFLPTVEKLLSTYCDLDAELVQTDNIVSSKAEIESSLDSINNAFEKMFDGFFAETAMDISSDIDVLDSMFTQKGLKDSDFGDTTPTLK